MLLPTTNWVHWILLLCSFNNGGVPHVQAKGLQYHEYVLYPPHTFAKCPLGHTHIADQRDCHIFYHCKRTYWGVQMIQKTCGDYMMFHPVSEVCDWPFKVRAVRPECYYESMSLGLWRPVKRPSSSPEEPKATKTGYEKRPLIWSLMDMATDIVHADKIKNNADLQLTPAAPNESHSDLPQKDRLESITATTTTRPIETEVIQSSFPLNSTPLDSPSTKRPEMNDSSDVAEEDKNHQSGEVTRHSHVHVQGVCHHDPNPDFNPMASQEGVTNETNRPSPSSLGTHTIAQSNHSPSPMNPWRPDNESLLNSISQLSLNSRLSLANDIKEKLKMERKRQKLRKKSKLSEHRSRKWKSIVSPVNGKFSLRTMRVFTPGNFTALKNEQQTLSPVKKTPLTKLKANPFISINIL